MDLTGDGRFTISDIWALFELLGVLLFALFFLPANLILMGMYWLDPKLPAFFELGPTYEYTMGWGTGIVSAFLWAALGGWIIEVKDWIEDQRAQYRYAAYRACKRQSNKDQLEDDESKRNKESS